MKGLYVHIPFCTVKCRFCDFAAFPGLLKQIPQYLEALQREMALYRGEKIDSLYFGGGTPSLLETDPWNFLMQALRGNFEISSACEVSMECNPETVTPAKLAAYAAGGVNRLSLGLQATQDSLLKSLGRLHNFDGFLRAFKNARVAGFKNINIDLMFGLPGQTMADWKETLQKVADLEPEHVSCYALYIEEKTAFYHQRLEVDDGLQAEMYAGSSQFLGTRAFEHYEISNFSRAGFKCAHNLKYWRNQDCLGLGVGASAFINGYRRKNTEKFSDYIRLISEGKSALVENYALDFPSQTGENLMLALRLKEGAILLPQTQKFYGKTVEKFLRRGWMVWQQNRLRLTLQGWLFSNQIFVELLSPN